MSFSEWKSSTINDVLEIKYGKDHKHLLDGNIPVYGSGGIMRFADKFLYDKESILIPRKGTLSNLFYLDKPFWSVDTMFYTKIKDGNNGKFLYYLLKSIDLASMNVGSAVPSLTTELLNKVEISLPNLTIQKSIANILSSLDDKIELNRQTNQTLEEIAQTLFKEMCLPKSEILSANWKIDKLNSVIEFIVDNRGKTPPISSEVDNNIPLIEVNALVGSSIITNTSLSRKGVTRETFNTWFRKGHPKNGDVLFSTVGTIGEVSLVFNEEVCIAQNIIALRSTISGSFLYFSLRNIKNDLLSLDVSSVQPSIKVPHLLDFKIIIPPNDVILDFEIKIKELLELIYKNEQENLTLIAIRDSLLPKLIKGEIAL
jgi:type I restriction enzyme S subunit